MSPDQPESPQQQDVDVRNNRESRAYAAEATQRVARASNGGAPPRRAPRAGEMPEHGTEGTASGNPVAGVEITAADRDDSVEPSQDTREVDGPTVGHA
jgi:hypothetical protein